MRISDWSSDVCSSDLNLLDDYDVKYSGKAEEQPSFWMILLYQSLPFLLILGIAFFVLRQMQKGSGSGAMGFGKSKAKLLTEKQGKVTFDDVAGIDEAREELRSEEHTSELQSLMRISYAVFCLKKKKNTTYNNKQ